MICPGITTGQSLFTIQSRGNEAFSRPIKGTPWNGSENSLLLNIRRNVLPVLYFHVWIFFPFRMETQERDERTNPSTYISFPNFIIFIWYDKKWWSRQKNDREIFLTFRLNRKALKHRVVIGELNWNDKIPYESAEIVKVKSVSAV